MFTAAPLIHAATLAVQPRAGEPTTRVDLRGGSMGAFEAVDLRYGGAALGVTRADADGAFRADDVVIPASALPGRRAISAVGRSTGTRATALFLVRANWPQFHRGPFRHGETPHENVLGPAIAAALAAMAAPSWAHGPTEPKHGGVVQAASDLDFELAPTAEGVSLYIDDHGKPLSTQGASGKLTVLSSADKNEVELTPAGDNRLDAKGVSWPPAPRPWPS